MLGVEWLTFVGLLCADELVRGTVAYLTGLLCALLASKSDTRGLCAVSVEYVTCVT